MAWLRAKAIAKTFRQTADPPGYARTPARNQEAPRKRPRQSGIRRHGVPVRAGRFRSRRIREPREHYEPRHAGAPSPVGAEDAVLMCCVGRTKVLRHRAPRLVAQGFSPVRRAVLNPLSSGAGSPRRRSSRRRWSSSARACRFRSQARPCNRRSARPRRHTCPSQSSRASSLRS